MSVELSQPTIGCATHWYGYGYVAVYVPVRARARARPGVQSGACHRAVSDLSCDGTGLCGLLFPEDWLLAGASFSNYQ